MKMKKIVCSLMISVLCFMTAISGVSAASYDTSKIDNAYNKVIEYYKQNKTIKANDFDTIIAIESLGLEVEDGYILPENLGVVDTPNPNSGYVGAYTGTLLSEILIGNDPTDVKGTNFVKIVEDMVKEDGSFVSRNQNITSAGDAAYIVYSLYALDSAKLDKAADILANMQNENGSYGYAPGTENLDITGWVIEALNLVDKNKYSSNIVKAKTYLASKLDENDGAYSDYNDAWQYESGKNSDTQSSVLTGLFVDDKNGVLNGSYDKGNLSIIDYLLAFQKNDGSFYWTAGNDGYSPSKATADSARCLGTYRNGSVFEKARKAYYKMTHPEQPGETKPTQPTDTKKDTQSTNKVETTNQKTTSVKTGDETNVVIFVSLSMVSGGLFLVLRKEYERVH